VSAAEVQWRLSATANLSSSAREQLRDSSACRGETRHLQAMADLQGTHSTQLSPPSALQLLPAQQKTVIVAAAVNIVSHDVASRVDPTRLRKNGSRYIDGSKFTLA
jgi:hypothetical protein